MSRLPATIGPYAIARELGRGGMGTVYEAVDPALGRRLAVKVLIAEQLLSPKARERFTREALALAKASHPGVIAVHACGEDKGQPWIAMDLAAGSLADRLEQGPLQPREAAELVARLADALAFVHAQGILHRDLKPNNVLFDEQGAPRLTDFGLARQLDPELTRLSESGIAAGTPGYMAPEQVRGEGELTAAVDVYGLGGLLFAALTGKPPFSGPAIELLIATVSTPPPLASSHEPTTPPALDAICARCLAKSPGDRYPSAAALAADLRRYLDGTWRPPARRGQAALALALSALLVGGLVAAWSRPSPADGTGQAASTPRDRGQAELRQTRGLPPHLAYPALQAWLRAYPEHPQRDEARRRLADLRERPLWSSALAQPIDIDPNRELSQHAQVAWWGDALVAWVPRQAAIEVWAVGDAQPRRTLPGGGPVTGLLPHDELLLAGLEDGRLRWLSPGGEVRLEAQAFDARDAAPGRSWGIAVSSLTPGRTAPGSVWAGSQCGLVRLFDGRTPARQYTLRHGEPVSCLRVLDAQVLLSGGGWSVPLPQQQRDHGIYTLRLWTPDAREPVETITLGWRPNLMAQADDLVAIANTNREVRLFRWRGQALESLGYLAGEGLPQPEDQAFIVGAPALGGEVHGLAIDATRIYAGGHAGRGHASEGDLRAWSRATHAPVLARSFRAAVASLAVRDDLLAVGLVGGHVEVWALPPGP